MIAASIGVVYIIVGLIYFLIFIHNVSESNIISERTVKKIVKNKKHFDLTSPKDGYIQEINYKKIQKITHEHDFIIVLKKVVGQFISTESRIITIYTDSKNAIEKEIQRDIYQSILIGSKKTEIQDFSFTIQKIVEIAIKALSLGINDPNTAIQCLRIIGLLLRDLADIDNIVPGTFSAKTHFSIPQRFISLYHSPRINVSVVLVPRTPSAAYP